MNVVIGQSGTIYNAKTLEELTRIDYVYMQIERIAEYAKRAVQRLASLLKEAFSPIIDLLKKLSQSVEENQSKLDQQFQIRKSWSVDVDTRVKSQVLDNRPQHHVRKILR